MIKFITKKFSELSVDELYQILALRAEVFIIEQDCIYPDIDGNDQKALHIIGYEDAEHNTQDTASGKTAEIVAYARIFDQGQHYAKASIGRVVVKECVRKHGYGHQLVDFSIQAIADEFDSTDIQISAQVYLSKFYHAHGFNSVGDIYLEDGIEHIEMHR